MSPQPQPTPKPRKGCLFYGCLTLAVLSLAVLVGGGIGVYFLYQKASAVVQQYASTKPMDLPPILYTTADKEAFEARLNTFSQGLREGNLTAPLILKGEDLNLLLASSPDLQFLANGARISVTGDQIKGQLSLKLGDLGAPFFKDRYLNGEASFKVSLADGRLSVTPDTILVGGKPIPNEYLQEFRKLNLVESANQNSEFVQTLEKLQSIAVTNGEVQVVPKEVP